MAKKNLENARVSTGYNESGNSITEALLRDAHSKAVDGQNPPRDAITQMKVLFQQFTGRKDLPSYFESDNESAVYDSFSKDPIISQLGPKRIGEFVVLTKTRRWTHE